MPIRGHGSTGPIPSAARRCAKPPRAGWPVNAESSTGRPLPPAGRRRRPAQRRHGDHAPLGLLRQAAYRERAEGRAGGRHHHGPALAGQTDKCSPELPGWTANHFEGVYVALDNLDRAGDCDSWAAIFFKGHGARFVPLEEPNFTWTAIADELIIPGGVVPRVPILVHVYNASVPQATVDQDVLHARKVFGPLNRSGIWLQFRMHTGTCPAGAPPLREINLCYVTGLNQEASLTSRSIKVGLRNFADDGVALHRTGTQAGAARPGDPDLKDNIMRKLPVERGGSSPWARCTG